MSDKNYGEVSTTVEKHQPGRSTSRPNSATESNNDSRMSGRKRFKMDINTNRSDSTASTSGSGLERDPTVTSSNLTPQTTEYTSIDCMTNNTRTNTKMARFVIRIQKPQLSRSPTYLNELKIEFMRKKYTRIQEKRTPTREANIAGSDPPASNPGGSVESESIVTSSKQS